MIDPSGFEQFQRDLEALQKALDREFPDGAMDSLSNAAHRGLLLLATYAAEYPPAPSNSSYIRTGTLGRLWATATPRVTMSGHVLDARIRNATPYGPLVQQRGQQRRVHRGRWQTTDDVMEQHLNEVEPLIARAGGEIVARIASAV